MQKSALCPCLHARFPDPCRLAKAALHLRQPNWALSEAVGITSSKPSQPCAERVYLHVFLGPECPTSSLPFAALHPYPKYTWPG